MSQQASGLIPIAGSMISSVFGTAVTILENVDKCVASREECTFLADRAVQLLMTVEKNVRENPSLAPIMLEKAYILHRVMRQLQGVTENLIATSKLKLYFQQPEITTRLSQCDKLIQDACQHFEIGSLIAIGSEITQIATAVKNTEQSQNELTQAACTLDNNSSKRDEHLLNRVNEIREMLEASSTDDGMYRFIRRDEIRLVAEMASLRVRGAFVYLHSGIFDGRVVVVKSYRQEAESSQQETTEVTARRSQRPFEQQVQWAKQLWHPNIGQLIGYSRPGRSDKFIVYQGCQIRAGDYIKTLEPVIRVCERFRIAAELGIAQRFLQDHEISWCGDPNDVLLYDDTRQTSIGALGSFTPGMAQATPGVYGVYDRFCGLNKGKQYPVHSDRMAHHINDVSTFLKMISDYLSRWQPTDAKNYRSLGSFSNATVDEVFSGWTDLKPFYHFDTELLLRESVKQTTFGRLVRDDVSDLTRWSEIPVIHGIPLPSIETLPEYGPWAFWDDGASGRFVFGELVGVNWRWKFELSEDTRSVSILNFVGNDQPNAFAAYWMRNVNNIARTVNCEPEDILMVTSMGQKKTSTINLPPSMDHIMTIYFYRYPVNPDGSTAKEWGFWSFDANATSPGSGLPAVINQEFQSVPFGWYYQASTDECELLRMLEDKGVLPRISLPLHSGHVDDILNGEETEAPSHWDSVGRLIR